ncbi:MAG: hypothetical protein IT559_05395 [Alphaproteobacteria bacterium]|nr:hypothetical protein [Alphaproteobacteria bacterium]
MKTGMEKMKKYNIPVLLCICVIASFPAAAGEETAFSALENLQMDTEQSRVVLPLAGQEDQGTLGFFIGRDKSHSVAEDAQADRLNNIAPAAGVQFRLEF